MARDLWDKSDTNVIISEMVFAKHYQLIIQIGAGSFAEVWKAHDIKKDCDVALKIFPDFANVDATKKIKKEYENVTIQVIPGEPEMVEIDGMLTFKSNDQQIINISDETLAKIIAAIENTRTMIINL